MNSNSRSSPSPLLLNPLPTLSPSQNILKTVLHESSEKKWNTTVSTIGFRCGSLFFLLARANAPPKLSVGLFSFMLFWCSVLLWKQIIGLISFQCYVRIIARNLCYRSFFAFFTFVWFNQWYGTGILNSFLQSDHLYY